jgi:hypothetical protein
MPDSSAPNDYLRWAAIAVSIAIHLSAPADAAAISEPRSDHALFTAADDFNADREPRHPNADANANANADADTDTMLAPAPRVSDEDSHQQQSGGATQQKVLELPLSRAQVVAIYNSEYVPGNTPPAISWTGSVAGCNPGTISAAMRTAMITRLNVFRKLSRIAAVAEFDAAADDKDERTLAASLLYSANNMLSHSIPPTWTCYPTAYAGSTVGALGASAGSASNIGLSGGSSFATPAIINAYIDDSGSTNNAVGHRRWILNPRQTRMTTSSVSSGGGFGAGNALWVINAATATGSSSAPDGVAWPPRGFVPFQLLPGTSNRWSFSYPGAGFANATVTMTKNGQSIAILNYDSKTDNGYGDNTIVWRPNNVAANGTAVSYANPGPDQDYVVTISGVTGAATSTFTYTVTVIDVSVSPTITISGTAQSGAVPLMGVMLCTSGSGASCSVSGSSYSCSVPSGWTGSIHPSHNTEYFAAGNFANVTANTTFNFVSTRGNDVAGQCNLDVDGNGRHDAATDGVLILRRMLGFSDAPLTANTGALCAIRSGAALQTYIDAHAMMDVDASGGGQPISALTDGLLILRAMLGLTGTAVTNALTARDWDTGSNPVKGYLNAACGMGLP